jgi:hypothetical protein
MVTDQILADAELPLVRNVVILEANKLAAIRCTCFFLLEGDTRLHCLPECDNLRIKCQQGSVPLQLMVDLTAETNSESSDDDEGGNTGEKEQNAKSDA